LNLEVDRECLLIHNDEPLTAEKTAWYDKESVSFSDLLKAIRTRLWRDNLFFRKGDSVSSGEITLEEQEIWRDWLVETLTRAA
jgi:hypothetical protein